MSSYNDTTNLLMRVSELNEAQRAQEKADFYRSMNNLAGAVSQHMQNGAANYRMNTMSPPRAEAVNPAAPAVMRANAQYGPPAQPHTGGVDELALLLRMREQELADGVRQARIGQILQQDAGGTLLR